MYKIGFIGAGNMGGALIVAACNSIGAENVVITETKDHTQPLIAGLDTIHKSEFGVEFSYENGEQMSLTGDEADVYGNQFRYEVREETSDEVLTKDAESNVLGIGTYLVTAIHRTISAIRSKNTYLYFPYFQHGRLFLYCFHQGQK